MAVHKLIWLFTTIVALTLVTILFFIDKIYYNIHATPLRWLASVLIPTFIARRGLRKKSLSYSGAIFGCLVAFLCTLTHWSFLFSLMFFYLSGSKVTKFKEEVKKRIEGTNHKEGGQRDWVQVLCNGGVCLQLVTMWLLIFGIGQDAPLDFRNYYVQSYLGSCVLGALACSGGDTFASEIGSVLSKQEPVLITTLKRVPRGTNGGISIVGLFASILGGLVVGIGYLLGMYLALWNTIMVQDQPWHILTLGAVAGLIGSLIDSLLGATLQYSGWDEKNCCVTEIPGSPDVKHISGRCLLDNHAVNLLSGLISAYVTCLVARQIFY